MPRSPAPPETAEESEPEEDSPKRKQTRRISPNKHKYARMIRVDDIETADDLFAYLHQNLGCAMPIAKDRGRMYTAVKSFEQQYPGLGPMGLAELVQWERSRTKKHRDMVHLVSLWRYALQDGYLRRALRWDAASTMSDAHVATLAASVQDVKHRERILTARTDEGRLEALTEASESNLENEVLVRMQLAKGEIVQYRENLTERPVYLTVIDGQESSEGDRAVLDYVGEASPRQIWVRREENWLHLSSLL